VYSDVMTRLFCVLLLCHKPLALARVEPTVFLLAAEFLAELRNLFFSTEF